MIFDSRDGLKKDWLDNEYIYTLRKYLDDYNSGVIDDSTLKFYKELTKGKFVIYDITPYFLGGIYSICVSE